MDFLNQLKAHLESNFEIFDDKPVYIGYLRDGNSVTLRPTPNAPGSRYMNGQKIYVYQFQLLVRHESDITSYQKIEEINQALDEMPVDGITSQNGSFFLHKIEIYNTPNFVENTERGSIWTAMYEAELLI